jgi:ubiquinone/menaquinone biosynthesis C-methylase UbiE
MDPFDGPVGWITAKVMAIWNADAEAEAIRELSPVPGEAILVIGFGPGVGVEKLSSHQVAIVGVDPSSTMVREASRRNRSAIASGRIKIVQNTINEISWPDDSLDGALAVHTLQMCQPLARTARVLRSMLRPGGRFVSITHDWALAKQAGSVASFVQDAKSQFETAGFVEVASRPAQADRGRAILFQACNGKKCREHTSGE